MFVRPAWKPESAQEIYRFIEAHPWAILANNGPDGPYATNVPLLLDRTRGDKGVLVGHLARANEHARVLESSTTPALAIFQGPSSYVTASWYPNRDMPPTVYYTAVHCYGAITMQSEEVMHGWLETLTERYESAFEDGWSSQEIAPDGVTRRLGSIVGFEISIERIEAKFKLGQDEPRKDALAVAAHLERDPAQESLCRMVRRYNERRDEDA